MTVTAAASRRAARAAPDPGWVARRRWARAGLAYLALLLCSLVFLGPLLFGALSSLKTDPLESPPRVWFEQLDPRNWGAAWRLGVAGAENPVLGGFAPGADVRFEVRYLVPPGQAPVPPQVSVPRRQPGAQFRVPVFAADHARTGLREVGREAALLPDGGPATRVTYEVRVTYPRPAGGGEAPRAAALPLDLSVPTGQTFAGATLDPSRVERRGRAQSWDNITPGVAGFVLRNYVRVFDQARSFTTGESLFGRWLLNSFLFVVLRVVSGVVVASLAGYALARLRFPGRGALFLAIIFTMTVPAQVTFISNYLVLRDLGLLNSVLGLWAVLLVGAGQVFLMKQFFETLPRGLEEAARVDGAGPWTTFTRVMLPLSGPALVALTITTAQGAWNEYFWALVVLQSPDDRFTLPIGLNTFQRAYGATGDYGLILAGAVISALPVILLFVVFQQYFVEGASFSAVKE